MYKSVDKFLVVFCFSTAARDFVHYYGVWEDGSGT